MSHKQLLIFLVILLALLIVPTTLPYIIGHLVLPWWSYVFYAIIILVNAGIYLIQRCILIDEYFVQFKIGRYVALTIVVLIIGFGLQFLAQCIFGRFDIGNGTTVNDFLGFSVTIGQLTMMLALQLITTFIALTIGMSSQWRIAAFRYNEAERCNQLLKSDIEKLHGEVDKMKSPSQQKDSITVKIDMMKRKLPLDEILYVKSDGDYVVIHLSNSQAPMVLMTLKALEKQLPYGQFCRIHRSYLVNVSKVNGMKDGKVLIAGEALSLSNSYKAAFFELLSHKSIILS